MSKEWTIISDRLPKDDKTVDLFVGLKILYNYKLTMDNDTNYHFEHIYTGTVIDGFDVDEWRYNG